MSTVCVPVYWLSLMHRSHLLWSPLQPGGSPRWLMTDAHNCCCPWLKCSPSLQIKKKCPSQVSSNVPFVHTGFLLFFHLWVIFYHLFCISCGLVCISTVQHLLCMCLSPLLSSPLHPPFFILGLIPCPLLRLIFELDADWGVLATMRCTPSYHLGSVSGLIYMAETGHVVMNHLDCDILCDIYKEKSCVVKDRHYISF